MLSEAVSAKKLSSDDVSGAVNVNSTMKQPAFSGTHAYSRSGREPTCLESNSPSSERMSVTVPAQSTPRGHQRKERSSGFFEYPEQPTEGNGDGTILGGDVGEADGEAVGEPLGT